MVDIANKSCEVFELSEVKYKLFSYIYEKGKISTKLLPELVVNIEDIMPNFTIK